MNISNHCPKCKKPNVYVWVWVKSDRGDVKICKDCADARDVENTSRYEITKKRLEAERKAANASIVRQIKSNTYPKTPGSHK